MDRDFTKCDNYKDALTPNQLKVELDKVVKPILKDDVDLSCCERIVKEEYDKGDGIARVVEHKVVLLQDKDTKEFCKVLKIELRTFHFCNRNDLIPQDIPYRYIYFKLKDYKGEQE